MILLFKKAFFVISLSSLVTLAQADPSRKGTGSDGGGGCSVLHQSHWILKDFVRAKMENRLVDQLGQKLSMNTVGEKLGFEPLDGLYGATPIQQIGAYQYLQKKIKLWQEGMGRQPNSTGSRNLLDLISWGLQRVKYTVVPYVFQSIAFGCTNQNEIPILIYGADYESALISLPQWNQLDLQSQAGSLLKEVFRFLQTEKNSILFSGSNMSEESERRISKALSLIILSHPNEISSESDILFRSFVAKDDELLRYPHQMKDWRLIQEVMMKVERSSPRNS